MRILVTGSKGQLGSELAELARGLDDYSFCFVDIEELDICSATKVEAFFNQDNFDYCINCAAYTAVDKSEENEDQAIKVNVDGPFNLAIACKKHGIILIHISTDFVFDGKNNIPYKELEEPGAINVYGETKLKGEKAVQNILNKYFIIRTSWLYSSFGNNFVKTMLRLGKERESLGVVDDQIGTPTYARDLAKVILTMIKNGNSKYGLYHYSNEGVASWYDFAKAIFEYAKIDIDLKAIPTEEFPLPAKRPHYTVLNKSKIKENTNIKIPYWRESLIECLEIIKYD